MTQPYTKNEKISKGRVISATVIRVNRFVKWADKADALEQEVLECDAGDNVHGISRSATAAGETANIKVALPGGFSPVEAGAAVPAGDPVAADADGRAITATGAVAVAGYAMQAASAAGDLITINFEQKSADFA